MLIVTDKNSLYPTKLAPATTLLLLGSKAGTKHSAYGTEERVRLLGSDEVKNLFYMCSFKPSSPGDTHESGNLTIL
jgi:hypothetical protein